MGLTVMLDIARCGGLSKISTIMLCKGMKHNNYYSMTQAQLNISYRANLHANIYRSTVMMLMKIINPIAVKRR